MISVFSTTTWNFTCIVSIFFHVNGDTSEQYINIWCMLFHLMKWIFSISLKLFTTQFCSIHILYYGGYHIYYVINCCIKWAASNWDFELGASDAKKDGKVRIYSGDVATWAVSVVGTNVSGSLSSTVVPSADGICDMIWVVTLVA